MAEMPLEYAGETSRFRGTFRAAEPGAYEVTVFAYDAATGNTGVDGTTFLLSG